MSEAYKIGVKILVGGNVAEALGAMSSKLLGIHGKVKDIEKSLSNWKGLVASAAAVFTGVELFKGLKDVVEHGAKLEKFESQAKAAGYSAADQVKLMGAAWKNAGENINASATASYKNLLELAQVTGSVGEAMRMLPTFTKTDMALSSLKDDEIRGKVRSSGQTYDFARSLELLGVTQDEKKLDSFMTAMTREMIGMRGLVDGSKLYQGVQNAGGARYGWNQDFVGAVLGPLLQESARNGFGLFQLDRSFGAGVMTMMMAQGAEKYGFFDKADEFSDAHGRFKGMKTGSIAGYDLLRSNPEEWALKVALPLFASHGVDVNNTNAMAKAIIEISRGNKNLNVILDALLLPANRLQLAKERSNIERVPLDAADILQKNDPALAMQAFTTQWDNLLTALGKPLVADATAAIREIASAIQFLAKAAADHPELTKIGGELTAVAAGLLVLAGSIGVVKFALNIGRAAGALGAIGGGGSLATAAVLKGAERAAEHNGLGVWKAAQQASDVSSGWSRFLGGAGGVAGKLVGPLSLIMALRDVGELMNPTTPLGAPYRFDTATPDWRERFERSTRTQKDLHQGADMEAARGTALGALPQPNVNVKVDVAVSGDLKGLINAVVTSVSQHNDSGIPGPNHDLWHPPH